MTGPTLRDPRTEEADQVCGRLVDSDIGAASGTPERAVVGWAGRPVA
jgi:hypothetical protein